MGEFAWSGSVRLAPAPVRQVELPARDMLPIRPNSTGTDADGKHGHTGHQRHRLKPG
jgi:hypothetical protein